MLVRALSLLYSSWGLVTGGDINAHPTGIVQIKTNSREVGRVTEKGGAEELVEEVIQKKKFKASL